MGIITMRKYLIALAVLIGVGSAVYAGLPPTTSKLSGDSGNITTFNYQFPNFTGTHSGITTTITGVNSAANIGGGTTNALPYQSAPGTTTFLSQGTGVLQESAGAPSWTQSPSLLSPTATTQPTYDQSTKLATDAYVWNVSSLTMAYVPLNLGSGAGGQYSFASNGAGAVINLSTSGGVVTGAGITYGGTGYAVGDILVASSNGGNHDCYLWVTGVSGGAITSLQVLYGGTGYSSGTGGSISAAATAPFTFSLAGTLSSNATILVTNGTYLTAGNQWIFYNNTSGGSVTVKMSNGSDSPIGTGVTIPSGSNNNTPIYVNTDGETDVWYGDTPIASLLSGTVAISNGGTGQTTQTSAFNALSPITTAGDLIVGTGTSASGRLAIGTSGQVLESNGTTAIWVPSALISPLPIANGGTGATTAATALSNLGGATNGANSNITSLSGLTTPLSVAQGGTGLTGGAWTSYSPSCTATSGSFTTCNTTGGYQRLGKTVFFYVNVTEVTLGSASGQVVVGLPTSVVGGATFIAREISVTGTTWSCTSTAGNSTFTCFTYNNGVTVGTNYLFIVSGTYQGS